MRKFSGFVFVILFVPSAFAQAPPPLSLGDAVAEAIARNPEIAAARRRYDAALQRPAQEHALPDPMLSAGWSASGHVARSAAARHVAATHALHFLADHPSTCARKPTITSAPVALEGAGAFAGRPQCAPAGAPRCGGRRVSHTSGTITPVAIAKTANASR